MKNRGIMNINIKKRLLLLFLLVAIMIFIKSYDGQSKSFTRDLVELNSN